MRARSSDFIQPKATICTYHNSSGTKGRRARETPQGPSDDSAVSPDPGRGPSRDSCQETGGPGAGLCVSKNFFRLQIIA